MHLPPVVVHMASTITCIQIIMSYYKNMHLFIFVTCTLQERSPSTGKHTRKKGQWSVAKSWKCLTVSLGKCKCICNFIFSYGFLVGNKSISFQFHFYLLPSWLQWCKWKACFSFGLFWVIAHEACPPNCSCQACKSWESPLLSITRSLFLHNPIRHNTFK